MISSDRPLTSLRLILRWSNSSQTWQERIGDFALLGGLLAAAIFCILVPMEWWQVPLVLALGLVPSLPFSVLGWLKVFGPVLYYDMIRQARRKQFTLMVWLYVLLLAFLLSAVAIAETEWGASRTDARDGARIAQKYFDVYMIAQFCTVILLTPAYVAGAIAEEKERQTLEFMLATDLLNREIVLSKLGSRVANLCLLALAGLPILSILQFLGGVDPNLVLAGFVVTMITVVGQASVSILCSVLCKRPRDAITLAYLAVIVYYAGALAVFIALNSALGLATMPIWFGDDPPIFAEAVDIYNKGNLVALLYAVYTSGNAGTLATDLPIIVGEYGLFHGLLALACTALAVARIRRTALAQMGSKPLKKSRLLRARKRPAVGVNPMWWKEMYFSGGRSTWTSFILLTLLAAATFVPVGAIVYFHLIPVFEHGLYRWSRINWTGFRESMNVWTRFATVTAGILTVFAVAIRASTSITTERDKQTFDTLLTTPLSGSSIFNAKWAGSFFGSRRGMLWLALIWIVALCTGGMHWVALPLLIFAWAIYAAFAVTLGLWFSIVCRSTMQATVFTIIILVGCHVGHWLVWILAPVLPVDPVTKQCMLMAHFGHTPPLVMGFLPFSWAELSDTFSGEDDWLKMIAWCMGGLVVWAVATMAFYVITVSRFRKMAHRDAPSISKRDLRAPAKQTVVIL
jgi:ABC-type transport system involved in multi-copper enzyme maturation permease subunit